MLMWFVFILALAFTNEQNLCAWKNLIESVSFSKWTQADRRFSAAARNKHLASIWSKILDSTLTIANWEMSGSVLSVRANAGTKHNVSESDWAYYYAPTTHCINLPFYLIWLCSMSPKAHSRSKFVPQYPWVAHQPSLGCHWAESAD